MTYGQYLCALTNELYLIQIQIYNAKIKIFLVYLCGYLTAGAHTATKIIGTNTRMMKKNENSTWKSAFGFVWPL